MRETSSHRRIASVTHDGARSEARKPASLKAECYPADFRILPIGPSLRTGVAAGEF